MSIQRLEIEGFRSLQSVTWEPGPLNVLIGVNGSGKSNLLRALQLLKSAADGKLSESVRAAGGMVPLLWDGQVNAIKFSLQLTSPAATYELVANRLGQSGAFYIESEFLIANGDPAQKVLERTRTRAAVLNAQQVKLELNAEAFDEDEPLIAFRPVSELNQPFSRLQRAIANFYIYHDVRVDSDSEMRRATVSRRDLRVDPDGSNLISVLHTLYTNDRYFKDELNAAMKAAFGDEFEELVFPPAEDGRIQLRLRWRSLRREQSASDLSDGTLRFLFLLTVLAGSAGSDPPSLIAIDEPETGLHPSMLPLIAEYATDAARYTQVIFTTHSPQFLNGFKGRADITTIVESIEGKSRLRRLPEAELSRWLEHFQLGDLMLSGELESIE
ncbi:MAG: AAA family ATPase [Chloroflexi bacterium]|nr:AAA family ATPase [Chloroflexota bacterium]